MLSVALLISFILDGILLRHRNYAEFEIKHSSMDVNHVTDSDLCLRRNHVSANPPMASLPSHPPIERSTNQRSSRYYVTDIRRGQNFESPLTESPFCYMATGAPCLPHLSTTPSALDPFRSTFKFHNVTDLVGLTCTVFFSFTVTVTLI